MALFDTEVKNYKKFLFPIREKKIMNKSEAWWPHAAKTFP